MYLPGSLPKQSAAGFRREGGVQRGGTSHRGVVTPDLVPTNHPGGVRLFWVASAFEGPGVRVCTFSRLHSLVTCTC